jgi:pimeloyl-ACP methyl ester carboxylesterase
MLKDPAQIDPLAVHLQTQNAARTRINSVAIANTDTLRRCLPEATAPLAGIWGEADATAAPFLDERRQLLRSIDREAEFVVIEGAGHWVMYEAPEAFNPALLEILRRDRTGRSEPRP